MKNKNRHKEQSYIYPGEYVGNGEIEKIKNNNKQTVALNLTELPDLFKIEMFIPGVSREDIVIDIVDNVLTVRVTQKKKIKCIGEVCSVKEFESEGHIERKVVLPKKIDAIFTNAEYKSGVLKLHVPKSNKEEKITKTRIVVY